ncbi:hypothetical protein ACSSS7_006914 [Eimeria intestinalis]
MAPETYQVKLPVVCFSSPPSADGEAEEELGAVSPLSPHELPLEASEVESDPSRDSCKSDDGGCSDSSSDIITSAAATWCVHAASQAPEGDPLVSFFAQLVSSHTIVGSTDDVRCEQQQDAPRVSEVSAPDKSPCSNDSNARDGSIWVRTTCTSSSTPDEVPQRGPDEGGFPSATEEGFVANSTDRQLRLYIEGSLKRTNFSHILGSLRSAIRDNPGVCGLSDHREDRTNDIIATRIDDRTETQGEPLDSPLASTSDASGDDEHSSLSLTADDLLPPPVPVNLDFCHFHPRIAANWLVHAQVTASLMNEKGAPPPSDEFKPLDLVDAKCRLDVDTEAQLACLVAPGAFTKGAAYSGSQAKGSSHQINPVRDALKESTDRLLRCLDAEGTEALAALLHSWYYSGFFTGQLRGHSRGLID